MRSVPNRPVDAGLTGKMKAAASKNAPPMKGSSPSHSVNNPKGNAASDNRRKLQASKSKFFDSPSDRATIKMRPSSGDRGYVPTR